MNYNNEQKSLLGLKRHIKTYAQREAFSLAIGDIKKDETPHLDYYKKHTHLQPKKPVEMKRDFDDDLEI